MEVPLLMPVVEGEKELLAMVVPERSSSLLLWLALLFFSKSARLHPSDSASGSATSLALSAAGGGE
jgi:hypothetical protein